MSKASFKIKPLSKLAARDWCRGYDQLNDEEFERAVTEWRNHAVETVPAELAEMRSAVVGAFDKAGGLTLSPKKMYPVDVEVGLALYEELQGMGFTMAQAADDDIWRALTIKVFPDLTYLRFPEPDTDAEGNTLRLRPKRFYSHTKRIWVKTLWWYIHLAWQGSPEATRDTIAENGSNIISHTVETPGRGFRVDVYRAFLREYSKLPVKKDVYYRKAEKLRNAECRNFEPALYSAGIDAYCASLFERVIEAEEATK